MKSSENWGERYALKSKVLTKLYYIKCSHLGASNSDQKTHRLETTTVVKTSFFLFNSEFKNIILAQEWLIYLALINILPSFCRWSAVKLKNTESWWLSLQPGGEIHWDLWPPNRPAALMVGDLLQAIREISVTQVWRVGVCSLVFSAFISEAPAHVVIWSMSGCMAYIHTPEWQCQFGTHRWIRFTLI